MRSLHQRAWLLTLLSAALQILIFPLPGLYWLAWIALTPLLVALLRARVPERLRLESTSVRLLPATPLQGFLLGYACGILWYAGTCYWIFHTMHEHGGISAPVALLILLAFCLYLGLYHALFGLLVAWAAGERNPLRRYVLLLSPFLWVAVELARTRITAFPWELLGTSQVSNIPLAQVATYTGVYGISFEVALVNAALAGGFLLQKSKGRRLLMAAGVTAVFIQLAGWIPRPPLPTKQTAVLVQENVPVLNSSDWTPTLYHSTLSEFEKLSVAPLASGEPADLIVWPESPTPFFTNDSVFREAVSSVAQQSHAWVVAGSLGVEPGRAGANEAVYNSAVLVSPRGLWTGRYDKVHLVPFGEYVPFRQYLSFMDMLTKEVGEFNRGSSRAPLQAGSSSLGIFICYESVFPDEVRRFAASGAQVLVNISNDGWYGDSGAWAQHLQQARMRAVENGRWVLRATNTGLTAAIDPYGRVVASIPRRTRARLEAQYALIDGATFYTRHGDWFAYLCAIISIVALAARFLTPGRQWS